MKEQEGAQSFGAGIPEEQTGRFLVMVRRGHEVNRCDGGRRRRWEAEMEEDDFLRPPQ